jgi:uncharacterized membrane protein YeaQ/YmgE (transglycosylase-associated protein family)
MNLIAWVIMGGLAGWVASLIMRTNSSQGLLADIFLGVFGAVIGGLVMNFFGQAGVTGFNVYSLIVATLGAVTLIAMSRLVTRA